MQSDKYTITSSTVKLEKGQPFGAHFATKLDGVNNKLLCTLAAGSVGGGGSPCSDDIVGCVTNS